DIRLVDKNTGTSQTAVLVKSYTNASLVDTIGKAFQNSSDENQAVIPSSNNAQLLQELWLKASPQEREAFAAWLATKATNAK
ncbi:MAG TPA: DUF3243 family protein, partial [Agitococcus sp.]|nr:DUF3243 family protein [Agitococcus sp.]HNG11007.1 DUF3243 family protein [Agitococcus sp.]